MQIADLRQTLAQHPPSVHGQQGTGPEENVAAGNPDPLSSLELESFLLNLDGALKVRARHQLFNWTQGALRSLIQHELLICAMRNDGPALRIVDSFSMVPVEPAYFN